MLKLSVTIDVEEEGLFSGKYEKENCSAKNLERLGKLDPIFKEYGIRPTLLVAYQAANNPRYGEDIMKHCRDWDGEVGAHLHHWNTPPIIDLPHKDPVPSDLIPKDILSEKIWNLFEAIKTWSHEPTSFRMGRFNLGPRILELLHGTSILVDSSVAPLRRWYGGPNHIDAGPDPYYPDLLDPSLQGSSKILEAPITITPIFKNLGAWLGKLDRTRLFTGDLINSLAEKGASIPAQPMWTGLKRMKLATVLHEKRGGQVINTFFHSSELMPMGNPKHPTEYEIGLFIKKLADYFQWLAKKYGYESVTLTELKKRYPSNPVLEGSTPIDVKTDGGSSEYSLEKDLKPLEDLTGKPNETLLAKPAGYAPVKLVILMQDMEFGGAQRYVGYLLKNMDKKIFRPELWLLRGGEGMLPFAQKAGIPVKAMCNRLYVTPGAIFRLFINLREHRPDILYTITGAPNGWGRIFARILGTPVIIGGYRSMVPKPYERWFWKLSHKIICNARESKNILIKNHGVDPELVTVIPNAVDTDHFSPAPEFKSETPTIVCVARLVFEKDPITLFKAMKIVRENIPEATLEMIGGGYLEKEAREFISANQLEANVKLMLSQSDILSFLRNAWIFAISSVRDSAPNSVLEAMSVGLPVVGTKVGGIPEMVEDGRTGIIVPPKDPESLAGAILELLQDDRKRNEMGAAARQTVIESHSPEVMTKATEKVFKESLLKHSSKAGKI